MHEFLGMENLAVPDVESIQKSLGRKAGCSTLVSGPKKDPMDIAALMLIV